MAENDGGEGGVIIDISLAIDVPEIGPLRPFYAQRRIDDPDRSVQTTWNDFGGIQREVVGCQLSGPTVPCRSSVHPCEHLAEVKAWQ